MLVSTVHPRSPSKEPRDGSLEHKGSDRRSMRVLQIIEATLGGTLRYLENIAAATEESGLQLGLAYGTHRSDSRLAPLLKKVEAAGWCTYKIDMRREVEPWRDLNALLNLRKVIRDFQPDIIHCHSSKGGALGRLASVLQKEAPARLYTPNALAVPLGRKYLKLERLMSHVTDSFVAVSDSERDEIEGFGLNKHAAIDVVYPLIDSAHFAPASRAQARKTMDFGPGPLILGIGRLMPQKDPGAFVEIIKRVHENRPDVRAVWLGSGDGEMLFRAQIQEARLENIIRLVPWQHDVRTCIAAANVLLSTSQFESFGYMVAEALSMGVPAVATDVTGTCDVMRGDLRQWLYPKRDYKRATDLVCALLGDLKRAEEIGAMARHEVVRRFNAEQMRDALMRTYAKALRPSPPLASRRAGAMLEGRAN